MTSHRYSQNIASASWQARRGAAMAASGGMCQRCGRRPARHVHHLTYRTLGYEPLADLMPVCPACHDAVHLAVSGQMALPI